MGSRSATDLLQAIRVLVDTEAGYDSSEPLGLAMPICSRSTVTGGRRRRSGRTVFRRHLQCNPSSARLAHRSKAPVTPVVRPGGKDGSGPGINEMARSETVFGWIHGVFKMGLSRLVRFGRCDTSQLAPIPVTWLFELGLGTFGPVRSGMSGSCSRKDGAGAKVQREEPCGFD